MTTKTKGHEIKVMGFGPSDFTGKLVPGFNVITAANGSGKTRVLTALAWALGCDVPADLRHGADRGYVEIDGTRIRTLEKRIAKMGDLELALNGSNPISDIILPDITDPKRAEVKRVEALLRLVDIPVDDEAISTLVDGDENVIDHLAEVEPGLKEASIVAVADKIRRRTHELKRRWESAADQEQGKIAGIKVQEPERVSEIPVDRAQANYDAAVGDLREAKGSNIQRQERERQIEALKGVQFEKPDVEAATNEVELARANQSEMASEIRELEARLEAAKARWTKAGVEVSQAISRLSLAQKALKTWEVNNEVLNSDVTGATQADVDAAATRVEECRIELDAARETARWKESSELALEAQKNRDSARKRAAHYEALATGVTGRLSKLLEKAGLKSLTVDDGKLCYVHDNGKLQPFTELSWGQRTRAIMPLLTKRELPYGILVLPRQFYDGLDPAAKQEVGQVFADAGVMCAVEEPGENEKLEVAHV